MLVRQVVDNDDIDDDVGDPGSDDESIPYCWKGMIRPERRMLFVQ